jgi:hypothetical protein
MTLWIRSFFNDIEGNSQIFIINHIQWVVILKLYEKVQEPYIFNNCFLFLDPPC